MTFYVFFGKRENEASLFFFVALSLSLCLILFIFCLRPAARRPCRSQEFRPRKSSSDLLPPDRPINRNSPTEAHQTNRSIDRNDQWLHRTPPTNDGFEEIRKKKMEEKKYKKKNTR